MADAICSVDDCQTAVLARGWCGKHYRRWQTTGDPTAVVAKASPEARFWRKVNKTDSCWLWTAGTGGALGYGRFREGGRKHQAHRWAYESLVGPIPDGLHLDHLCRVPACVNPAHLEPVTNRENFLRSNAPAAIVLRTGACMRGHEWSDENTYVTPAGQRICRPCRRITHALRKGRA